MNYVSANSAPVESASPPSRVWITGIGIDNLTLDCAVRRLVNAARNSARLRVSFVNAHNLNLAWNQPRFRRVLRDSSLVLGDGSGLQLAARLTGQRLLDNVNGTDLFPRLWAGCQHAGLRVFLLGGRPGIAELAGQRMDSALQSQVLAGSLDGFFKASEADRVIDTINAARPDLLLVGMGTPHQENWLARHGHRIAAPVRVGVGGLFDFYSCRIPRAPRSWRRLGIEWVWRLIQEPSRMWRRYLLGNPAFVVRALRAGTSEMNP